MKKLLSLGLALVVVFCLGLAPMAEASRIGELTNTGYTFMGGWRVRTQRDSFLIGNAPADGWFAFSWLKFGSLPASEVEEAWLSLEVHRYMGALTPGNPMDVTIYAVSADVTGITAANVVDFKLNHIVGHPVATATLTGLGYYAWDITPIVNDWITGNNYGLAVIGWDDEPHPDRFTHPRFVGLPAPDPLGMSPILAATPIPEPATLILLGTGLLGMLGFKRGKKVRR